MPSIKNHSHNINMFVVRKPNAEFRDKLAPFQFWISEIAETRKQPSRRVFGRHGSVTVRANQWRGAFTGKELLLVAIQTARVFRKLCDIGKSGIAFANVFEILGRYFVTGIARELLRHHVRRVRELSVIDLWLRRSLWCLRARSLPTFLRLSCPRPRKLKTEDENYSNKTWEERASNFLQVMRMHTHHF